MLNKLSLQASMTVGIIAMGVLGVVLAMYVGESYRDEILENQRQAYEDIIHLRIGDTLKELIKNSRDLGQRVQNNMGFRDGLKSRNKELLDDYLDTQFQQYFVTAGIIKLNSLIALDANMNVVGLAVDEADHAQGLGGVPCPGLHQQADQRSGANRLKYISQLCMHQGYPLMHVMIPIGGFK
ncbi:hypothetical protein, partial [Kaarinaea lacus]